MTARQITCRICRVTKWTSEKAKRLMCRTCRRYGPAGPRQWTAAEVSERKSMNAKSGWMKRHADAGVRA